MTEADERKRKFYDLGFEEGSKVFDFLPEYEGNTETVEDCIALINGALSGVIENLYELIDCNLADDMIKHIAIHIERARQEGHFDMEKFISPAPTKDNENG